MNILALDVGTQCGWAHLDRKTDTISFGHLDLETSRWEGGGMRFLMFKQKLQDLRTQHWFDVLVYEEVRRHKSTDAAHMYGGWQATLGAWCEENSIPYRSVPVGTWKRHLTGNGNAGKPMVKAYVERIGFFPKTLDESDALGIVLYAETILK